MDVDHKPPLAAAVAAGLPPLPPKHSSAVAGSSSPASRTHLPLQQLLAPLSGGVGPAGGSALLGSAAAAAAAEDTSGGTHHYYELDDPAAALAALEHDMAALMTADVQVGLPGGEPRAHRWQTVMPAVRQQQPLSLLLLLLPVPVSQSFPVPPISLLPAAASCSPYMHHRHHSIKLIMWQQPHLKNHAGSTGYLSQWLHLTGKLTFSTSRTFFEIHWWLLLPASRCCCCCCCCCYCAGCRPLRVPRGGHLPQPHSH
jgi:hypothetical protein